MKKKKKAILLRKAHKKSIKKGITIETPTKDTVLYQDFYNEKFIFLLRFIDQITIECNPFPSTVKSINKELQTNKCMAEMTYSSHGLKNQQSCIERFYEIKGKDPIRKIHLIAPYFGLLKRIVAMLYKDASKQMGEDKSAQIFKKKYKRIKKDLSEPDLEGYIPNVAIGKAAAAAAAAAAIGNIYVESMFDYLANNIIGITYFNGAKNNDIINKPLPLAHISKLLDNYKHRKGSIEAFDDIKLYLFIEDFIIRSRWPVVKEQYTKEELRAVIKKEFNTLLFSPLLSLLFHVKDSEQVLFTALIIREIVEKMEQDIDIKQVLKIINIDTDLGKPDFDAFERRLVLVKNSDQLVSKLRDILLQLHQMTLTALGIEKTKEIFQNIFNQLKVSYEKIPEFKEWIKTLPPTLFVDERRAVLSPQAASAAATVKRALQLIDGKVKLSSVKSKDINSQDIKQTYLNIIGPMGEIEFHNLNGEYDYDTILAMVGGYKNEGLLNYEQYKLFKNRIDAIFSG